MKKTFCYFLLASAVLGGCKDQINTAHQNNNGATTEKIVYSTLDHSTSGAEPSIVSVDADGSNSLIISSLGAVLAASETKILWTANNSRTTPDWRISNNVGGDAHGVNLQLYSNETLGKSVAISSDGTMIAYDTRVTGTPWYRLIVANADGSNRVTVSSTFNDNTIPCFAPDKTKIYFYTVDGQNPTSNSGDISRSSLSGLSSSSLCSITNGGTDGAGRILWSKLGTIAYFDDNKIYYCNADGSNKRPIADGMPTAWSPDGTTLAYAADPSNLTDPTYLDVFITNDEGLTKTNITNTPLENEALAAWSGDGKSIVVTKWQGDVGNALFSLHKIDVATKASVQIASPGAFGQYVK